MLCGLYIHENYKCYGWKCVRSCRENSVLPIQNVSNPDFPRAARWVMMFSLFVYASKLFLLDQVPMEILNVDWDYNEERTGLWYLLVLDESRNLSCWF